MAKNLRKAMLSEFIGRWRRHVVTAFCLAIPDDLKRLKACDVLLFCHDVDRGIDLSGKAYSPLIDSIREDFNSRELSCISIAHFGSLLTGNKGHGEPVSFNRAYIRYFLKRKALNLLGIPARLKTNPFINILDKTGAKLIVTIGSPIELALAAKTKGAFHVEILHGIGYSYIPWGWDKLPAGSLPHGILSLDQTSTKTFRLLESKGIDVHTIPHPFLKKFNPNKLQLLPADWSLSLTNPNKYYKHILVSLTWGYAGDHGPAIHLANILSNGLFFNQLGEVVGEEQDIFWHFRFHPVQLRKPCYKHLLRYMDDFVLSHSNSEWREASRVPFPEIAMYCDGNISMNSMSCYDAAAIGLPSLMLCPNIQKGGVLENYFADLEDEGYATKALVNKEMLRSWVHKVHRVKPRVSNLEDVDAWEGAVRWMLQKSGLEDRN